MMLAHDTNPVNSLINIYLAPIHRCGNKREDERATLVQILQSGRIALLPSDIRVVHSSSGAPKFSREIGLSISISHSDHILAIAIYPSQIRVGIDIEEREDKVAQLISRVANEEELSVLRDQNLEPIILWSAKEAVFKAFSDRISTMSEQVVLKSCDSQKRQLTMLVREDEVRYCTSKVNFINYLSSNLGGKENPFPFPFVLSFSSDIPDISYQLECLF